MHMQHGAYLVSICAHIRLQAQMCSHMRPKLRRPRCPEGATTEGPGPHPPPHHQRLGVLSARGPHRWPAATPRLDGQDSPMMRHGRPPRHDDTGRRL